ncbi:uncharacterized protein [Dermacentor albipictus]|uniref:uncharacterized protein n=1 Tax=Dermacentor albipictus TaxID=60249 RepID=UPI0031FCDF6C
MAAAAALCARLVAGQLLLLLLLHAVAAAGSAETEQPSLLASQKHRFVLPVGRAASADNQSGDVLNLYDNVSRLIHEEQDAKVRAALRDSLQAAMRENIENLVAPGKDVQRRAKVRQLGFGSVWDGLYVAQRYVLVGIIAVVVTVSLVVLVYWFVAHVIRGAMRRSPSSIGLTELEDLDVYSTDDDGSSAGRYNRARKIALAPRNALLGYRPVP